MKKDPIEHLKNRVTSPMATDPGIREMVEEVERLRKFVAWAVVDVSFEGCNADGADIQDKAEELGLIELRPCKEADECGADKLYFLTFPRPSDFDNRDNGDKS